MRTLKVLALCVCFALLAAACPPLDELPPTAMPPTGPRATAASPTPTAQLATPTAAESLRQLIACDRLQARLGLGWGLTPAAVYAGDPRRSGRIVPGDYVRILSGAPEDGHLHIDLYPHDGTEVRQVWIDWRQLTMFRADLRMFRCLDH